jgi:hypothetical protein
MSGRIGVIGDLIDTKKCVRSAGSLTASNPLAPGADVGNAPPTKDGQCARDCGLKRLSL